MAVLNNYSTPEAVEAALNKGIEAHATSEQNKTDIAVLKDKATVTQAEFDELNTNGQLTALEYIIIEE